MSTVNEVQTYWSSSNVYPQEKNVLSLKKTITQLYPCGILKVQSPDYIIQYASPEIFYKMAILTPK